MDRLRKHSSIWSGGDLPLGWGVMEYVLHNNETGKEITVYEDRDEAAAHRDLLNEQELSNA